MSSKAKGEKLRACQLSLCVGDCVSGADCRGCNLVYTNRSSNHQINPFEIALRAIIAK